MRNLPLPGEIYTHYKGGTYRIMCLTTHTETKENLVIYKSLNFGSIHARPVDIFMDKVEVDYAPIKIDRFQLTIPAPSSVYTAPIEFEF